MCLSCSQKCDKEDLNLTLLHSERQAKIVYNFGLSECSRVKGFYL